MLIASRTRCNREANGLLVLGFGRDTQLCGDKRETMLAPGFVCH